MGDVRDTRHDESLTDQLYARIATLTKALRELVEALPECVDCGKPAMREYGPAGEAWHECDEHSDRDWGELEHAPALRAALEALGDE